MIDRARELVEHGASVILDASWSTEAHRSRADALAAETASALAGFVCEVSPAVADERARSRARAGDDASDATPAIAAALRERFAPWPGAEIVDTTDPPDVVASRMRGCLGVAAELG